MKQPEPHPDDLLCAAEICRLLKISRRTFQRLRENGKLPPPTVQWNRTGMRWRRSDILILNSPLPADQCEIAVVNVFRHISAAIHAMEAASHHAKTAANALRFVSISQGETHAPKKSPITKTPPQPPAQQPAALPATALAAAPPS